VVKPHGLEGELRLELFTDFPDRLQGREVMLSGPGGARTVRVLGLRGLTGSRAIARLEGIGGLEEARALQGSLLSVCREQIPDLPEGEYYEFQIVGLRVVTTDGRDLGRVTEVLRTGANDVYLTERLPVPAVDRFIRSIDLERGEIVVEGVDELLGEDEA